jgi:hypothetical protein
MKKVAEREWKRTRKEWKPSISTSFLELLKFPPLPNPLRLLINLLYNSLSLYTCDDAHSIFV